MISPGGPTAASWAATVDAMANDKQSGRSCKRAKAMIFISHARRRIASSAPRVSAGRPQPWRRKKTPSPQGEGACRFYLWAPALPLRRRALNVAAPKTQIVTSPAGSGTAAAGPVVHTRRSRRSIRLAGDAKFEREILSAARAEGVPEAELLIDSPTSTCC